MAVFCDVAPYSLLDINRRFGGASWFHIRTTSKTGLCIPEVRTGNRVAWLSLFKVFRVDERNVHLSLLG
jgi:hypothetical protein